MSRPEKLVLLRHPDNYEETKKHLKFDPFDLPTSEFESWNIVDDPKYMLDPLHEMMEMLSENVKAVGISGMRIAMQRRAEADTAILGLLDGMVNENAR